MGHDRPVDRKAERQVWGEFQQRILQQLRLGKFQHNQQQQRLVRRDAFRAIDSQFREFFNDFVVLVCHNRDLAPSTRLTFGSMLSCSRIARIGLFILNAVLDTFRCSIARSFVGNLRVSSIK
ncbi:hypothetical protein RMSM_00988 [Rhodopirellula maiorica SM1]|uniref:Uncharacterized protein n=1 Tax=Rhodopirellula maiorica SM1 TaxID=1265738 RepID=M5S7C4_9BACT|nr:hypothetical protein RMSM_00988 [Rhodopirellula maiorica SM1]